MIAKIAPFFDFRVILLAACALLLQCGVADAESVHKPASPTPVDYLPEKLGAPLPGFPDATRDGAGTARAALPAELEEAAFIAYDGHYLRFYDEGDDDGYNDFDPAPAGDAFWKGRFRPIFAKLLQLPGRAKPMPVVSLRFGGMVATSDEGDAYRPIFPGLPRRSGGEASVPLYRDVLDVWQNPKRPAEILALNKHELLYSNDSGASFRKFDMGRGDIGKATLNVLTARIDAEEGRIREIWIGTYLRGIARCVPTANWSRVSCGQLTARGLPSLIHETGSYFIEEISGIAHAAGPDVLITTSRFQAAVNLYDLNKGGAHASFPLPGFTGADHAESLFYDAERQAAIISTNRGLYIFSLKDRSFRNVPRTEFFAGETLSANREEVLESFNGLWPGEGRIVFSNFVGPDATGRSPAGHEQFARTPANMRAMYISPTSARSKRRMVYDLLDNYNFNAAVIDVKDDFGRLIYGSKLPEAKAMNNHHQRADIAGLLKEPKARGIYTIARQVVFKDKVLFGYQNNKYAIRDVGGGAWVGSGEERWVDTYSSWVHDYNVKIAAELVELGFDEIQFDYIRFPSDGPIGRCRSSYREGDAYKSEALENFLMKARRKVSKPISVDIYGYHGIYRAGTVIGQDMIDVGEFVDVVSPMHYSSHFGNRYLDHYPRETRAYELLKLGTERPMRMGQGRFQVRPWIQSFKMKISIWGWGETYMRNQILGSVHGGASGFLWWGPIKEFYLPGRVQNQLVKNAP